MQRWNKVLLSCLAVSLFAGADWLQFRGADTSNVVSEADLPFSWSDTENTAWKVPLPGRGLSGPIIVGDKVILTASSGYRQDRLHVLCFDAASGKEIWHRQFWATGRTLSHRKMCVATPTPASDGERIFAFYSSNDVICLDLDGNLEWFRGLTHDYPNASNSLGMSSSPVVVDDTLIVQVENDSESFSAGLETTTGEARWKIDRPKLSNWTSPTVIPGKKQGEAVVLLQSGDGLAAYEPKTGEQLWNYSEDCKTIPSATVAGDTIFVPSKGLTALRLLPGSKNPEIVWQQNKLDPSTPSPLVTNGMVFAVNRAGVLTCANAEDGESRWQLRLKGPFSATPLAVGSHLFFFNENGLSEVVNVEGEKGEIVATSELGETILATPAISGNALYVRSDGHLWKLAKDK